MVYDMTTFMPEIPYEVEEPIQEPSIRVEVDEDRYGEFVIEPLDPGYGVTLGNPMRRILYSGLEGDSYNVRKNRGRPARVSDYS